MTEIDQTKKLMLAYDLAEEAREALQQDRKEAQAATATLLAAADALKAVAPALKTAVGDALRSDSLRACKDIATAAGVAVSNATSPSLLKLQTTAGALEVVAAKLTKWVQWTSWKLVAVFLILLAVFVGGYKLGAKFGGDESLAAQNAQLQQQVEQLQQQAAKVRAGKAR